MIKGYIFGLAPKSRKQKSRKQNPENRNPENQNPENRNPENQNAESQIYMRECHVKLNNYTITRGNYKLI
jgi:hypothetical protein